MEILLGMRFDADDVVVVVVVAGVVMVATGEIVVVDVVGWGEFKFRLGDVREGLCGEALPGGAGGPKGELLGAGFE